MTTKIQVYEAEQAIANLVTEQRVIAYVSQLESWEPNRAVIDRICANADLAQAGKHDRDLYYTKSILVTSTWNKNDDVFDRAEVWKAKNTPTHKPTNLEHDEKQLVGHITDVWAIDADGNIIAENTQADELPNEYHLVNGAVIYRWWEDKELKERSDLLVEQIEAGDKFVSMECAFSDFDYAIITPDNQFKVIARNDDTAFLTKHLRSYGGTGVYEGNKVGRLLRNITFSGKGYVDNPANPDSIIFNSRTSSGVGFDFSAAASEANFGSEVAHGKNEELTMTDDYKERNAKLEAEVKELRNQLAEANVESLKSEIGSLTESLEEATTKGDELTTTLAEKQEKLDELATQLAEVTTAKDELTAELDKVQAERIFESRISALVEGGFDKETATAKVEKFDNLDDEQFAVLSEELIEAKKSVAASTETEETAEAEEETVEEEENVEEDAVAEELGDNEVVEETLESAEANDDEVDANVDNDVSEDDQVLKDLHALASTLIDKKESE